MGSEDKMLIAGSSIMSLLALIFSFTGLGVEPGVAALLVCSIDFSLIALLMTLIGEEGERGKFLKIGISSGLKNSILRHSVMLVILAGVLFPVLFIVSSAFSPTFYPLKIFPETFTLSNFETLLSDTPFLRWMLNTLVICSITVGLTLLLAIPAAYAFSRFDFSGKKPLMYFMIILQMFPLLLGMVAIYWIIGEIGLMNNYFGLILLYSGGSLPFYVWMLKGYIDTIPRSVDEAAIMDGCSRTQILTEMVFPLTKPQIGVVAFLTFIFPYSDPVMPSFIISKESGYTLVQGLWSNFIQGQTVEFGVFAAGVVIASLPLLVIFVVFQKYLITGMVGKRVKT